MGPNIRDANLTVQKAFPAGAATNYSDGINLEESSRADFVSRAEFLVEIPLMTTGELPDTKTYTVSLQHDTDPAFGTAVDLYPNVLVVTGAGGAGAAAVSKRLGIPSDIKSYVRLKQVGVATVDASTKKSTLSMVF